MKWSYLKLTLGVSLLLSVVPFVCIWMLSGFSYPRVPVEIIDDSLYYFARAVEVSQGHFTVGNPYSVEHNSDTTVAFFVADWIWALPLLLGFSLQTSIILNQIIYFLISGYLLFAIFSRLRIKPHHVPVAVTCVLCLVYWFLARPVAMQVVFPLFLLWIVSLYDFLCNPLQRKAQVFLMLTSVFSLYVYTYLTQIIAVAFFVGLGLTTLSKKFRIYKTVWISAVGAFVLAVPFLVYTWEQITHPLYFETLARIGLVYTHMIGSPAVFYLLIISLLVGIVWLQKSVYQKEELSVFALVSAGLLVTTVSNVITGSDLEVAVHVGRFVELWMGIVFCIALSHVESHSKRKVTAVLLGMVFLGVSFVGVGQIKVWKSINHHLLDKQRYEPVLNWLHTNAQNNEVVLVDDNLASYIPVVTNNYVLFSPNTLLYIASDKEVEDRYLLSRVFKENLTIGDIKRDMRKYAGAGHTVHRHMVHNRNVKVCKLLRLNTFGVGCGNFITQYDLKGDSYFGALEVRYLYFKAHIKEELKKFNVSYVVVDRENDQWIVPSNIEKISTEGVFDIYKVD